MLKLNPEKENLLQNQYGFNVISPNTHFKAYKYYGITICPISNPKFSGKISIGSFSKKVQTKLYHLIKDDILIEVPDNEKQLKIDKMKLRIENLQNQIKELEEETEDE